MTDAPLIVSADINAKLQAVRDLASRDPVEITTLADKIKTTRGKQLHTDQMMAQTVVIPGPWPFFVTYSLETGHPVGVCRHMSMSLKRAGRVPHPDGLWMVAELLGFSGGLEACKTWPEKLTDGGIAIHAVQPLAVQQAPKGSA